MEDWAFDNLGKIIAVLFVVLALVSGFAVGEEYQARRACYRLGYEFVDGNYFGGTTFCAEQSGATRRIITIQR